MPRIFLFPAEFHRNWDVRWVFVETYA